MTREQLDDYIGRMVASWPPLPAEQRERLRSLLRTEPRPDAKAGRKAA